MVARGSFRRQFAWALLLGGVAAACGGDTTSGRTASLTGGTGGTATGGTSTAGTSTTSGGHGTAGGTVDLSGGTATGGVSTGGSATGGANTGGQATGGISTGGSATGGARNNLCDIVSSLPAQGTACSMVGESRCDPSGARCACERGIWYCDHACPDTEPTPGTVCPAGAGCSYPTGVSCVCLNHPPDPGSPEYPSNWTCIGVTGCPASLPATGNACNNLNGLVCDYPNTNPAFHFGCVCTLNSDSGSGSTWTCIQSADCPATQPAYDPSSRCPGVAVCTYNSEPRHCACFQSNSPWICL